MKKLLLLFAALWIIGAHPAEAMYRCELHGAISFQDTPCESGSQTKVEQAGKPPPPADPKSSRAIQDQLASYDKERQRHDAEYALRDKTAALERQRATCDQGASGPAPDPDTLPDDNTKPGGRGRAAAAAAQAAANRCNARVAELSAEVQKLRDDCAAKGCQ
ncbi:MAG TPA: hypothetical protein VGI11_16315 [Variovorax sp.]